VFLSKGFSAEGRARLLGAETGAELNCIGGRFVALMAETATIRGAFCWNEIQLGKGTKLNLINAKAGAVMDDEASWPAAGNLILDGFVYDRVSVGPTDAPKRLEWLARLDTFTLGPYRQLAAVAAASPPPHRQFAGGDKDIAAPAGSHHTLSEAPPFPICGEESRLGQRRLDRRYRNAADSNSPYTNRQNQKSMSRPRSSA
jgi:hypothetical protein